MIEKKNFASSHVPAGNDLSAHALLLAEKGTNTRKAVIKLVETLKKPTFFDPISDLLQILSDALRDGWSDKESSAVLVAVNERLSSRALDLTALRMWIRAHRDDAQAVKDCLMVEPPEEMTILQLLSRAGSQKLVFLANWPIAQREVVLKRFIGDGERLLPRELQPHPLSMAHPNIIETHILRNPKGEGFLVERKLPIVLNDSWRSHGVHEAANLLRDIASALAFLQDKQLVHGDVKPDNIGRDEGDYILLDFGICRPQDMFAEDPSPTGSLRTRAPEVLLNTRAHTFASDIWALGATIFSVLMGRFPLFREGEDPPRVSNPKPRGKFEQELVKRVQTEWDQFVNVSEIPEPLRELLRNSLSINPDDRFRASRLVELAEQELSAFLRPNKGPSRFSPEEEVRQLVKYLPPSTVLSLMPDSQKHELRQTLGALSQAKGLASTQQQQVESLMESVT